MDSHQRVPFVWAFNRRTKSDENDPFEFRKQLIFGVFVALSQRSVVKFGGFEVRFVSFCFYCILPSG